MLLIESLFLQCLAIAIGACIGSFLNVVIYRVPAGLSILYPPSRCPHCLRQLAPRDNIPVIGWFLIKGKCRYCHTPVSWRYPAIEALTAFLFWCIAAYFGTSQPILVLCFYAAFISWLLALALIDIDTMTLPNSLTQSGLVLGFIYQGSLAFINSSDRTNFAGHLINAVLGAVIGLCSLDIVLWLSMILICIFLVPIIVLEIICQRQIRIKDILVTLLGKIWHNDAMGSADFRLMSMIGVWLGWQHILIVNLLAPLFGIFPWLINKLIRKLGLMGRQPRLMGKLGLTGELGGFTEIPYGVFLAMAATVSLFFGNTIIDNYLSILRIYFGF